jgi:hypothetical protein
MPKILDGLISCLLKNDVTSIKVVVNANNGNSLKFIIKNGFQEIPSKLKSEDNIDYYKYFIKEF